jgi:hypothetical protein
LSQSTLTLKDIIMAYTPSFSVPKAINVAFSTNNPRGEDRMSDPVMIEKLAFNEVTRSIEVTCSDRRTRQCRIDRMRDDKMIKTLQKNLQTAFDKRMLVQFVAAGGNDPQVWFYTVKSYTA